MMIPEGTQGHIPDVITYNNMDRNNQGITGKEIIL